MFQDDFKTIRVFAERDNSNIVHWSEFPDGGHFAAMERPERAGRRPADVLPLLNFFD